MAGRPTGWSAWTSIGRIITLAKPATEGTSELLLPSTVLCECEAGEALIPCYVTQLGEDTLVTATDYPHPDAIGKFPERTVGDLTGNRSLSASAKQSVLWENPARLFGIEAPSVT